MDPERETRLWPHDYGEVYQAFDRIFGCRGHGWANLQSAHLNLPFADDEEFARLHAAIRLVLPILPALAASSPDRRGADHGRCWTTGWKSTARTRGRSRESRGKSFRKPAFSQAEYQTADPRAAVCRDRAARSRAGVLQHEWLNARGAIARFSRNTIEIRVLDVQECPLADLAICAAIVAVLKSLVGRALDVLARQQAVAVEPLASILLTSIRNADEAVIRDREYLELFGYPGESCTAGELWGHLLAALPELSGRRAPGASRWQSSGRRPARPADRQRAGNKRSARRLRRAVPMSEQASVSRRVV